MAPSCVPPAVPASVIGSGALHDRSIVINRFLKPETRYARRMARIARWDFDAAELADKFDHGTTRGLNLTLPWPATPPPGEKLHLFVRYVAPDGRKLQSDREILRYGRASNRQRSPALSTSRPPKAPLRLAISVRNRPQQER